MRSPRLSLHLALAGVLTAGVALAAPFASAQEVKMPCSTARVIVPWPAGGESDIITRVFTDAANKLGAKPQLQVVNVSGQAGNKGTKDALAAPADGCTVFNVHQSIISAYLTGRTDFTWDAFIPIGGVTVTAMILGAHPSAPFTDLKTLQAYAKANPEKVLAGASLGSTSHFNLARMQNALGVKFKYIAYDGTRERMTALLSNTIQLGQLSETAAAQYMKSGELKVLGLIYKEKSRLVPEMKTAKDQGFDLSVGTNRGFMLQKGTPKPVVDYYIALVKKVSENKDFIRQIEEKGSFIWNPVGADYVKWWEKEFADWKSDAMAVGLYEPKKKS
jgi:tripartite-type tricarboxylate transporter receptor subunit TctC